MRRGRRFFRIAGAALRPVDAGVAPAGGKQLSIRGQARPDVHAKRVFQLDLRALLRRKALRVIIFGAKPPFFRKCAHGLRLDAHTEIQHEPLRAEIGRRNEPLPPCPGKPRPKRELGSGASALRAEAALKADPPWRGRGRGRLERRNVLAVAEPSVVKAPVQTVQIRPRLRQRRQSRCGADGVQNAFLRRVRRVFLQKCGKLRRVPLPRLLQRSRVAAGQQQPQKMLKILRDQVDVVGRAVHRADGKDARAKAAHAAEVDAVHPGPAEDVRALRRAVIRLVFRAALDPERRKVDP